MSDDIEKAKQKGQLEDLGRHVDRYAQSRSLGLLLPMTLLIINTLLTVGAIVLVSGKVIWWTCTILVLVTLWVVCSSIWLAFKLVPKYGYSFYNKDGQVELKQEKIPIWVWVVFIVLFLGATFFSQAGIMPTRWALTLALASIGGFVLYAGKKEKNTASGAVFFILLLLAVIVSAAGLPNPLADKDWIYSYFVTLMMYIVGSGLITAIAVHIYNRRVLRKIKEMRPFGEQQADKSDS